MLLLMATGASAQVLRVEATAEDRPQPVFEPAFIARNGITRIVGVPSVKRVNEPMREQQERYLYRFNSEGLPVYSNTSFGRPGSGTDTASVLYTYDDRGRLVNRLRNDLNGFFAVERGYDAAGDPVSETHVRIVNNGRDRYHFEPGERTVISEERFSSRMLNDSTRVRTHQNNLGLPYREQTFRYDRHGYLLSIEDHYVVSNRRGRTTFRYDERGRLVERTLRPDLAQPRETRETHRYDATGNLLETDIHHGDTHVRHEEYLYEESTGFLKARLTKDMDTGMIHVVRYHTERGKP